MTRVRGGSTVKVRTIEFPDVPNASYGDVSENTFDLEFKGEAEIERKLKSLGETNAEIAKNQLERTRRINSKIRGLYGKLLGNDKVSKEIVDRSYVVEVGAE